jgi:hypothetical protein
MVGHVQKLATGGVTSCNNTIAHFSAIEFFVNEVPFGNIETGFSYNTVRVKVPNYALISTHMHVQPTLYPSLAQCSTSSI